MLNLPSVAQMPARTSLCLVLAAALSVGCGQAYLKPELHDPRVVPPNGVLKVHMHSGELFLLPEWQISEGQVHGNGIRYDIWRTPAPPATVTFPVDSVALFETNSSDAAITLGTLGVGFLMTYEAALAIVCSIDPKSCFGSCPTFYIDGADSSRVRAEGFSSSVASVLEHRDVDALNVGSWLSRELLIRMRNEALETHLVRRVNVLAVPRHPGERIFALADSAFVSATAIASPTSCTSPSGDCLRAIAQQDDSEWTSRVDPTDLATREDVELAFERAPARAGLVLTSRNSLVTTFLFYQTLAYLGRTAGTALAAMERGTREEAEARFAMAHVLGGIEVQIRIDSGWRTVGIVGEAGPIAADTKVLALPTNAFTVGEPLRVRLHMAKGSWRVGWVALAALGAPVQPIRIAPDRVVRNGRTDTAARALFASGAGHMVTVPGDEVAMHFTLPQRADSLELFLESEGYYYEWMRSEWLTEENPVLAALAFTNPEESLRRLAPAYAAREPRMEQLFWSSRFNRRLHDAHHSQ